ncbi:Phosphosulfolactate synthase [Fusarium oxysporum f. sp. cubense race 1]|uniref:Phosphosulfolactate synthase n=1 Tax=Fusarium oxysporum f. sp. cubense (strain race 1) TaxID=1229664 RepID=N4U3I0_FUSC1|nr:Phosphosulfolactate synthase [Fusarium oxysporum f. sp. cubense race 1]
MSHVNLLKAARPAWRASTAIPKAAIRPFSVSRQLRTPPILLEDKDKGFGFIRHNKRPPKPRMGHHVDGLKFAGGSFSLFPEDKLKELINLAHEYNVYVSTGGWMEHVLLQSDPAWAVDQYLKKCKQLGFDVIEISSGFLSIPQDDWLRIVDKVHSAGLIAKPECGIQFGAGGDTEASELSSLGTSDPSKIIHMGKRFIDAGVERIMIESEGITENVKSWRTDVIQQILRELPQEKVMFEAADPKVFNWYVREFGTDVNLFVDHSQIVQLSCLREGIWGQSDTFGSVVNYRP